MVVRLKKSVLGVTVWKILREGQSLWVLYDQDTWSILSRNGVSSTPYPEMLQRPTFLMYDADWMTSLN